MLNWELELKKWCPAFKVLTYFGSQKERRLKRQGWSKENTFHICISSYKIVTQDQHIFRRKRWIYMILDEAQNIKNFKSQRWQILLNFNTRRRLLLTGTPLQNSLIELWSLMHFLMPDIFRSHHDFREWFVNPVTSMVEESTFNGELIARLHEVLRPFLLRRMKKDVEKQLPKKTHHIVPCHLSRRQQFLYDEFIASSTTQSTLSGGSFFGIANVLMQLRKVCNHPDLFASRPIDSPFQMEPLVFHFPSLVDCALEPSIWSTADIPLFYGESLPSLELSASVCTNLVRADIYAQTPQRVPRIRVPLTPALVTAHKKSVLFHRKPYTRYASSKILDRKILRAFLEQPTYGACLLRAVTFALPDPSNVCAVWESKPLPSLNPSFEERLETVLETVSRFSCAVPPVRVAAPSYYCSHMLSSSTLSEQRAAYMVKYADPLQVLTQSFHPFVQRATLVFPDKWLLQYDCGKLQVLAELLRTLKRDNHKALIFTQMTRMLDILESFVNLHHYTYLRLDGSTKIERRQMLVERFNRDDKLFLFLLSTRSGGFGINLTGADTVIFYDTDWNPAMDAQAQDRCHRIGQTREVHIYRLVTQYTIEENILKKAQQRRTLSRLVIKEGGFTTDFFRSLDLTTLLRKPGFLFVKWFLLLLIVKHQPQYLIRFALLCSLLRLVWQLHPHKNLKLQ